MNIDESRTAKGFTPAALVPAAFGFPRTIEEIIIHHWGERGQTHDGVCDFFCTTGPGATSAHFVASAGRVNCLVAMADAAWHCPGQNHRTVGIECRPEATDADYQTVAELIAWIRQTVGKNLPLSMHRDHYPTACPGVWDLARLDKMATAIQAGNTTSIQEDELSAADVKEIKDYIAALLIYGYNSGGKQHPGIGAVVEENQRRIGAIAGKVWDETVFRGGKQISVKQELADAKTVAQSLQAQIAGLLEVIKQLAKASGSPVDLEAVKAAAEAGAASALDDLNAVVTFGKAPTNG